MFFTGMDSMKRRATFIQATAVIRGDIMEKKLENYKFL